MENIVLFFQYLKYVNRAKMVDQKSYILEFFMSFITIGINFFVFYIIVKKINSIEGWSSGEITFFYAISLLLFQIANSIFGLTIFRMDGIIIRGDLDKYLIMPGSTLLHLILQNIHFFSFANAIAAMILVIISFQKIVLYLKIIRLFYFAFSIIAGLILYFAISIFFMSFGFRYKKIQGLSRCFFIIRKLTEFPLSILPKCFQYALTFIFPIGFISYYPCVFLFGKANTILEIFMGSVSPFISIILFILARKFFYFCLRTYYSSSGN